MFFDRGVVAVGGTPAIATGAQDATSSVRGGQHRLDTLDGQYLGLRKHPKIVERVVALVV